MTSTDSPPLRVLVNAASASSGGGWTYVVNVMKEIVLDSRGIDFTFIVPESKLPGLEPIVRGVPDARCRIVTVPFRPAPLRLAWEQIRLPMIARGYDVLYCVADIAPVWKTTRTVVALRNLNIYDRRFYDNARLRMLDRAARTGLRGASRVLFPSRSAAEAICEIIGLGMERVHVVPHGIDAARFRQQPHDASASQPGDFVVLIPAAVERHKNIEVAIDALAESGCESMRLQIAGNDQSDPDYTAELRARADRLGVAARVDFLGPVPYDDMPGLYARASAALLPSKLETFGHPMLEAMASGTPVVVPDTDVFREVAGEAGWLFDPEDGASLADALATIDRDEEGRARRVEVGRGRVEQFSWKSSVDALCDALEGSS